MSSMSSYSKLSNLRNPCIFVSGAEMQVAWETHLQLVSKLKLRL